MVEHTMAVKVSEGVTGLFSFSMQQTLSFDTWCFLVAKVHTFSESLDMNNGMYFVLLLVVTHSLLLLGEHQSCFAN